MEAAPLLGVLDAVLSVAEAVSVDWVSVLVVDAESVAATDQEAVVVQE